MGGGQSPPPLPPISALLVSEQQHLDLKGHLIFAWFLPKPVIVIDRIQNRYPNLKISFVDTNEDEITNEQYQSATVLSTMATLPRDPLVLEKIEFIHLTSAGINRLVSHPIFTDSKIPLTTSSGIHGPTIAEWVILTLLSHAHRFPLLLDWQKTKHWTRGSEAMNVLAGVRDYAGQTIAVLGYGSIGRQIARATKGLGMKVLAYTASPRETRESKRDQGYIVPGTGDPEGTFPEAWFSGLDKESLHEFLKQEIDVLVIAVPLTDKTKGIIGEEELSLLSRPEGRKPFLINIARGKLLSSPGLIHQLNLFESSKGQQGLRAAALDVTDPEPLPDGDELWTAPNLFISPHISAHSQAYSDRCAEVLEGNLERLRVGEKLWNLVDRKRGY